MRGVSKDRSDIYEYGSRTLIVRRKLSLRVCKARERKMLKRHNVLKRKSSHYRESLVHYFVKSPKQPKSLRQSRRGRSCSSSGTTQEARRLRRGIPGIGIDTPLDRCSHARRVRRVRPTGSSRDSREGGSGQCRRRANIGVHR